MKKHYGSSYWCSKFQTLVRSSGECKASEWHCVPQKQKCDWLVELYFPRFLVKLLNTVAICKLGATASLLNCASVLMGRRICWCAWVVLPCTAGRPRFYVDVVWFDLCLARSFPLNSLPSSCHESELRGANKKDNARCYQPRT
uniref:Uncharacterized protein n=1 Tax=Leersia perrieri TaxID=77586 RepID=A0A0D9WLI7_9ORYZ